METIVRLLGKACTVKLTGAASRALNKRKHHLCLEMELHFSCLVKKQVNVRPAIDNGISVFVNDKLEIGFRSTIVNSCNVTSSGSSSSRSGDISIPKIERYIPNWLNVDYKKGRWRSDFGYNNNNGRIKPEFVVV